MKVTPYFSRAVRLGLAGLALLLNATGSFAEVKMDTIFTFSGLDGDCPVNLVQASNGTFYGTTACGGKYDKGTLFKIAENEPLVTLFHFDGANGDTPSSRLLQGPDGNLYGLTMRGGNHGEGTIFRISPDGKFTSLFSFDDANGCCPEGDLLLGKDGVIYGSTAEGGEKDAGVIFLIKPGEEPKVIVNFQMTDGCHPEGLVNGEDGVYGATLQGGEFNHGTIFKLTADHQLKTIYSFPRETRGSPLAHLSQMSEGSWIGTTEKGGAANAGTIYLMSPGGKPVDLITFDGSNGAAPGPDMVKWNNGYFYMQSMFDNIAVKARGPQWFGVNFFGTTAKGGLHGKGTVFQMGSNGSMTTLVAFTGSEGTKQGAVPNSLIAGADGNLYGTTASGGPQNRGTLYRLRFDRQQPPHPANDIIGGLVLSLPPVVSP